MSDHYVQYGTYIYVGRPVLNSSGVSRRRLTTGGGVGGDKSRGVDEDGTGDVVAGERIRG